MASALFGRSKKKLHTLKDTLRHSVDAVLENGEGRQAKSILQEDARGEEI